MNLFLNLMLVFVKTGLFTIGGGLAMLPIIQYEVKRHGWLTHQQFLDILGVSQMAPGPLAVNTPAFIGYCVTSAEHPGVFWLAALGAFCCIIAVCIPSVLCVNLLSGYWTRNREQPCFLRVFGILRPVVAGLVISAAVSLVVSCLWHDTTQPLPALLKTVPDIKSLVIAALAFTASAFFKTSPVLILISGLAAGLLLSCFY